MDNFVTPKQVARAIGVSESSLKRWCDQGLIPSVRTQGGHRRLPMAAVVEYLRQGNHALVKPEAIGLPRISSTGERTVANRRERFRDALLAGDDEICRQLIFDLYLARYPIAKICDEVVAAAFHEIGNRWACQTAEVYQERRGCEITLRLLHELRLVMPSPPPEWRAVGGTLAGDTYVLPTTMSELVLREAGWDAVTLGSSLPAETIARAIADIRPRLVWISVSYVPDREQLLAALDKLTHSAKEVGAALALGGREIDDSLRHRFAAAHYCPDMAGLDAMATALRPSLGPAVST